MPTHLTPLSDPAQSPAGRRLAWPASDADGIPLGSAFLRLFTRPGQDHLAELDLRVHPAERRRGTGGRLLAAAVEAARADGRRSLLAQAEAILRARDRHPDLAGLCTDTAAENRAMLAINDALGYRPTHRSTEYQLDLLDLPTD
ncbi:GNAT family N-acetyltransferase [Embleya sp. NBC_00888]|uniref:GNAT family N-acetyltransferase n=1 Tax=Embleya sp. NBC_00888 TaxID=2975960 RepID=UPI00386FE260|nr:GNAT family N-acetyltransferase [Embleya sp. NBC_00888]